MRGPRAHLCPLPRRLLQQLEVAKSSKAALGKSPAKAPVLTGDAVTFELYWKPEQEQFAQTAKVSVGRGGTLCLSPKWGVPPSDALICPPRSRSWRSGWRSWRRRCGASPRAR